MKKLLGYFAIAIWLVVSIFSNAIWWIRHPDTALNFSNPLWSWLVGIYDARNASQETDLAFLVSSACIVVATAAVVLCFRRMLRKSHT
ncbi:hypothetical protein FAZ69_03335 [Trinickia terrae]|uniref:Uncharacterized protein n=1 Tax=Trinickia terrae TaxID=2571161 RepID=A0A4U1ICX9_9BURK|nr:hypothetical protein [Trinickia terrae]TKC91503.1 hypothetical protein FAZ69_03335 [Trinickia terrae]